MIGKRSWRGLPATLAIAIGCLSVAACDGGAEPGAGEAEDAAVERFDPMTISDDVVLAFLRLRQQQADTPEQLEEARRKVRDLYLLAAEAQRSGLLDRRTVDAELEIQTVNWIATRQLSEYARLHPIDDEAVRAEYAAGVAATGNREYRVRHILVADQERARGLIAALEQGRAFADLEASLVGELGPSNAGELGWVNAGQVPPEFAAAMRTLEPGTHTPEPVQTEYGWHVIRLEEFRDLAAPPLEEVRESIRNTLARRQVEAYLETLRSGDDAPSG